VVDWLGKGGFSLGESGLYADKNQVFLL